ncbi:MAG: hypothetical protein KGH63_03175, partial [Candidatus Micrarchaeota archaeon]|nr:hypothetical protein [Candidatus Micrarchaeota archaeon]
MGSHQFRALILLALVLAGSLLLSGCLGPIAPQDKFNSDTTVVYNLTKYLNPNLCSPVSGLSPCTCMVCSNQSPSSLGSVWNSIKGAFSSGTLESTLAGARCEFFDCNMSTYNNSISLKADGTPQTCVIRGATRQCFPRMFMIGQGPNAAEFSMAQRYCSGRLTMPVLWATPARNPDGTLSAL